MFDNLSPEGVHIKQHYFHSAEFNNVICFRRTDNENKHYWSLYYLRLRLEILMDVVTKVEGNKSDPVIVQQPVQTLGVSEFKLGLIMIVLISHLSTLLFFCIDV